MLDVIQTLAEMRVTGTEFCEDRPEEILGADITQQSDAERFAAEIHHLGALGMADRAVGTWRIERSAGL